MRGKAKNDSNSGGSCCSRRTWPGKLGALAREKRLQPRLGSLPNRSPGIQPSSPRSRAGALSRECCGSCVPSSVDAARGDRQCELPLPDPAQPSVRIVSSATSISTRLRPLRCRTRKLTQSRNEQAYAFLKRECFYLRNPGTRALGMFEIGHPDIDWVHLAEGAEFSNLRHFAGQVCQGVAGLQGERPTLIEVPS
jgi:hypothetical protein